MPMIFLTALKMKQKIKVVRGSPSDVQDSLYQYAKDNIVSVLITAAVKDALVVLIELKYKSEKYEPYTGITHTGTRHKDRKKEYNDAY